MMKQFGPIFISCATVQRTAMSELSSLMADLPGTHFRCSCCSALNDALEIALTEYADLLTRSDQIGLRRGFSLFPPRSLGFSMLRTLFMSCEPADILITDN
jgi:hypothetical protein